MFLCQRKPNDVDFQLLRSVGSTCVDTLIERILNLLSKNAALSDREITEQVFGSDSRHHQVNSTCRQMESGVITRIKPAGGLKLNCVGAAAQKPDEVFPAEALADGRRD